MARRLFDIISSAIAIVVLTPLIAVAAIAIRMSSAGPVFYQARRVGRRGQIFTMLKLRTMHCRQVAGSSITASNDPRVFPVGRLLRSLKIDELPQLVNVLLGDMSIVGPRPEAPDIVDQHYTDAYRKTLDVRPGLTSPGSVFYYTHGEQLLADGAAEEYYATRLLPTKMHLDLQYLQRANLISDVFVMLQTASVLFQKACGRKNFPMPQHMSEADIISSFEHAAPTAARDVNGAAAA